MSAAARAHGASAGVSQNQHAGRDASQHQQTYRLRKQILATFSYGAKGRRRQGTIFMFYVIDLYTLGKMILSNFINKGEKRIPQGSCSYHLDFNNLPFLFQKLILNHIICKANHVHCIIAYPEVYNQLR